MQLEEMRKNEDPRLSFSTPEFKEAQRIFTDNFKVSAEALVRGRSNARAAAACLHTPWADGRTWNPKQTQLPDNPDMRLYQKNFGRPVEWALVKDHAWSTPQLRKLDNPVRATPADLLRPCHMLGVQQNAFSRAVQVDVDGKPWPLDAAGKPILKT